jgi:hypothetical protein
MVVGTSEFTKKLVNCELMIFCRFQVDAKDIIKCPLEWWRKHKSIFPIVGFFIQQILRFIGSQIETKRIFFLANIFTNLITEDVVYNKKTLKNLSL